MNYKKRPGEKNKYSECISEYFQFNYTFTSPILIMHSILNEPNVDNIQNYLQKYYMHICLLKKRRKAEKLKWIEIINHSHTHELWWGEWDNSGKALTQNVCNEFQKNNVRKRYKIHINFTCRIWK